MQSLDPFAHPSNLSNVLNQALPGIRFRCTGGIHATYHNDHSLSPSDGDFEPPRNVIIRKKSEITCHMSPGQIKVQCFWTLSLV